jgi:hypothetical protein
MNVSELKKSNFLKKDDVGAGALVTIAAVTEENIAKEGAPTEMKWCLHVEEFDKPMVLNSTNGQLIAQITKSEESDNWIGQKIVLYSDPSITYGGKLVGGIRVRAPRNQAAKPVTVVGKPVHQPAKPALRPEELDADQDTPF